MQQTGAVTLRVITAENRGAVEALAVAPGQEQFVARVTESLQEAAETPGACPWFRATYAGDEPVGFVMISDDIPPERTEYLGPYFLWRLLIDERPRLPARKATTSRFNVPPDTVTVVCGALKARRARCVTRPQSSFDTRSSPDWLSSKADGRFRRS